jgi:hypothetical protein
MFLVEFVVDNMAVGQIFLLRLRFFPPNWHSTCGPAYLSSETSTWVPTEATVARDLVLPQPNNYKKYLK